MEKGIVPLNFKKRSSSDTIKSLIPTIDHYRSRGKTLLEIYAALSEKNLLVTSGSSNMAFGTFKNVYYQHCKKPSSKRVVAKSNSPQNNDVLSRDRLSPTSALPEPTLEKVDIDVDSSDEPLNEPQTQPQSFEERLAAHQRLAATVFYD